MGVKRKTPPGTLMYRAAKALQARVKELEAKLAEAEWLIRELDRHEGAEGWSQYLQQRLDRYEFVNPVRKDDQDIGE